MRKLERNKFKINTKSLSLSKINPYYDNKENYLPYKYKDPSFKTQYNGPLLQKDFYIINLMNNRLKKVFSYKSMDKDELPLIHSTPIEISKKTDLVFNSTEFEKQQLIKEYTQFAFTKLKRNFFSFNPVSSKNDMINYRKCKFKGIPIYKEKIRYNPKVFMMNFQNQINQNNYKNWEKIKEEYEQKEMNEPKKIDKYHDENKIWEILDIHNNNKYNHENTYSHLHITEEDQQHKKDIHNKNKSWSISGNKKNRILKSDNKSQKKIFFPIRIKDDKKNKE